MKVKWPVLVLRSLQYPLTNIKAIDVTVVASFLALQVTITGGTHTSTELLVEAIAVSAERLQFGRLNLSRQIHVDFRRQVGNKGRYSRWSEMTNSAPNDLRAQFRLKYLFYYQFTLLEKLDFVECEKVNRPYHWNVSIEVGVIKPMLIFSHPLFTAWLRRISFHRGISSVW